MPIPINIKLKDQLFELVTSPGSFDFFTFDGWHFKGEDIPGKVSVLASKEIAPGFTVYLLKVERGVTIIRYISPVTRLPPEYT